MRVLIVDDNVTFRRSIARVLHDALDQVAVGEAAAGGEALALVDRDQDWDLVLLDLSLPDRSGVEVLRELRRRVPATPVLVMSLHPEVDYGEAARTAGAFAYVAKGNPPEVIAAAVRSAVASRAVRSPAAAPDSGGGASDASAGATSEDQSYRLARALHDDIGQAIVAATLRLQLALRGDSVEDLRRGAHETIGVLREALESVRRLAAGLRPPLLDEMGLLAAVRGFLARVEPSARQEGLDITLHPAEDQDPGGPGSVGRARSEREIAAFRVVEDSVTNVLRHARARRAQVTIEPMAHGYLRITVEDDGGGQVRTELPFSAAASR